MVPFQTVVWIYCPADFVGLGISDELAGIYGWSPCSKNVAVTMTWCDVVVFPTGICPSECQQVAGARLQRSSRSLSLDSAGFFKKTLDLVKKNLSNFHWFPLLPCRRALHCDKILIKWRCRPFPTLLWIHIAKMFRSKHFGRITACWPPWILLQSEASTHRTLYQSISITA